MFEKKVSVTVKVKYLCCRSDTLQGHNRTNGETMAVS